MGDLMDDDVIPLVRKYALQNALEYDGKGNWTLNPELDCQNDLALKIEILRMAEENIGHEIKDGFEDPPPTKK